jgi:type 1 fimbria pilin
LAVQTTGRRLADGSVTIKVTIGIAARQVAQINFSAKVTDSPCAITFAVGNAPAEFTIRSFASRRFASQITTEDFVFSIGIREVAAKFANGGFTAEIAIATNFTSGIRTASVAAYGVRLETDHVRCLAPVTRTSSS